MVKQQNSFDSEINALQSEIDKQFQVAQRELDEVYKQNEKLFSEYQKKSDSINKIFSDPVADRELEKEIDQMAQEMGVKFEDNKSSLSSSLQDDAIEKEYQKILKEVESEQQSKQNSGPISKFANDRISDISTIVKSHGSLAEEFANKSTNHEEQSQLKKFSQDATKLTKILDDYPDNKTKQPAELIHKKISTVQTVVQKIYSGLKAGISKAVDKIKGLGTTLMNGIKSLLSKSPLKQNQAFSQTMNETVRPIKDVQNPSQKLQQSHKNLQDAFTNLQDQFVKVSPRDKKAAFAKYRQDRPIEKMSTDELIKETRKIGNGLKKQTAINKQTRQNEINKLTKKHEINKQTRQNEINKLTKKQKELRTR